MADKLNKEIRKKAIRNAQKVIKRAAIKKRMTAGPLLSTELLEDGNFEIFSTKESVHLLQNHLSGLIASKDQDLFVRLISFLESAVTSEDAKIRANIISAITEVTSSNLRTENISYLYALLKITTQWLIYEELSLKESKQIYTNISVSVRFFLEQGLWFDAEPIIAVLFKINRKEIEKIEEIQGYVSQALTNLSTKIILEQLIDDFVNGNEKTASLCHNILNGLGERAVAYLINRVMHSENKEERIALITLIPKAGMTVVPILTNCMEKNPPWFVVRNLVFIISEIGDSSLFSLVRPYLSYSDVRVQEEVIKCIRKIGGRQAEIRFIDALFEVDDELKIDLVRHLGSSMGPGAEQALVKLLERRHQFSQKMFADLLISLCVALRSFPSENCFEAITDLVRELKKTSTPEKEKIIDIAEESLFVIKPKLRHLRKDIDNKQESHGEGWKERIINPKNESTLEVEEKAFRLFDNDRIEEACSCLLDQITLLVEKHEFNEAEYLKGKLLEIDPLALEDVIRISEMIEDEKKLSMAGSRIIVWNDLCESMGEKNFDALYLAMKQQNYMAGETIVKAGEIDPTLYFINSGIVNLYCQDGNNELFLKKLVAGDVFGFKTFFTVSVWTHTLKVKADANVSVLHREKTASLNTVFPEFEHKLEEYCNKYPHVPELVKMSGSERRREPRYPVSVIINSILLDLYGNPGKRSFKGELINISKGGLCFLISLSSKKNAAMLLGRHIVSQIKSGKAEYVTVQGVIVSVQAMDKDQLNFAISIKFLSQIDADQVTKVVKQKAL